jgi:predicted acyl esterase
MARRRSPWPVHLLSVLLTTALLGAASSTSAAAGPIAVPEATTTTTTTLPTTGFRFVDIAGVGVVLKANVIAPAVAGRFPAVIFPSSWGLNDLEYLAQASTLASRGYVVVSYTPRGWWGSSGEINTAGPNDIADLSEVVDWTIANTSADPAHIGAAGISYGAGISLLGSAADPRIRAVAAMSGWTDLVYSLYADSTRHRQSAGLLKLAAELLGNPGPELSGKLSDFFANRDIEGVMSWARVRSPATYLAAINANRPAVLIANAWGDTVFPPNQLADFYGRLTGPKRLELRPGDHAVAEAGGLLGLPNDVWHSVHRWFDQYLAGIDTGIGDEPPVWIRPHNSSSESYQSWSGLSTTTRRYGLGGIRWWDGTGLLGDNSGAVWSKTLPADLNTTADGGIVLLTNGLASLTGVPPVVWLPSVDRFRAGVWAAERLSTTQRIRGVPRVHLNLTGTAARGTVVAYLYDLDTLGNAKLISHAPGTWLSAVGGNRTLDVALPATGYDLPAGHSLTLVVDTVDPLYLEENPWDASVTIANGSYLDIPLK